MKQAADPSRILDIAVRAYTVPQQRAAAKATGNSQRAVGYTSQYPMSAAQSTAILERRPTLFIVFDTETTRDQRQQLNFAAYRIYAANALLAHQNNPAIAGVSLVEEGLIYADNLPERAPNWFATLHEYIRRHPSDAPFADGRTLDELRERNPMVDQWLNDLAASPDIERRERLATLLSVERRTPSHKPLTLLSRVEFVEGVLFKLGCEAEAAIIGFHLPFDLSRLALQVSETKNRQGFSFVLWKHGDRPNSFRPRLRIQGVDSRMSFISFTSRLLSKDTSGQFRNSYYPGRFIDCRTLVFAQSNETHTLKSAGRAFGADFCKGGDYEPTGTVTVGEIDYCRQDVRATWSLYEKLIDEFERHPIARRPERVYSPSSIGKSYLDAMGITPPMEKWPDLPAERLGQAMSAYYGARIETRIRKAIVPVTYVDFTSEYPSVDVLMGMQRFLLADRLDIVDVTHEARTLLESVTPEDLFKRAMWPELACCFVQVRPDGDMLPVRAKYDGSNWGMGVSRFSIKTPLWYTLADCIVSKWRTGKAPTVLNAWRLVPGGVQAGLKALAMRGTVAIDPRSDDIFRKIVEERQRARDVRTPYDTMPDEERQRLQQFLKTLVNSTDYGISVEMNRDNRDRPANVDIHGLYHFMRKIARPETPGEWCFPPIAACITGAARLLLALLEHEVTALGGQYSFADTDGMAIVASEHGGLVPCSGGPEITTDGDEAIRALTWQQVENLIQRFDRLNPYDPMIVRHLLKLEDENFEPEAASHQQPAADDSRRSESQAQGSKPFLAHSGSVMGHSDYRPCEDAEVCEQDGPIRPRRQLYAYCIASKRYCLFNLDASGKPILRKASEHGLGHLLNPLRPEESSLRGQREWVRQLWQYMLERELELGLAEPEWLDVPAVSRLSVSKPALWHLFNTQNEGRPYAEQIKPFNFLLAAHLRRDIGGRRIVPDGCDPLHFQLVTTADFRPERWLSSVWVNRYDGKVYPVTLDEHDRTGESAVLQTYRDVLFNYWIHPEAKSVDADGNVCRTFTRGVLHERHIIAVREGIHHIGKEGNEAEERDADLVIDPEEFQTEYVDEAARIEVLLNKLSALRQDEIGTKAGISTRQLREIGARRAKPRASTVRKVETAIRAVEAASKPADLEPLRQRVREAMQRLAASEGAEWVCELLQQTQGTGTATARKWLRYGPPDDATLLTALRVTLAAEQARQTRPNRRP